MEQHQIYGYINDICIVGHGSIGKGTLPLIKRHFKFDKITIIDPEPVELHHWELYLASQSFHDHDGWTCTAPHIEVNCGAISNVQLHVIAPLAYAVPDQGKAT